MNNTNEASCTCNNCPGAGCTCGCQQPVAEKTCACGPQCSCGANCACVKA